MKKLIAMMLALVMTLSLFVACGGNDSSAGGNQGGNGGSEGVVKLTIGLPTSATVMSYKDNAMTKWLEEKCGVDLEFIPYAGGTDIATQIATTAAANQPLPDILFGIGLGDEVYRSYGKDGYFADLTPLYEDREGASKTFWTRIAETFTAEEQADIERKLRDPESGKIYAVPTMDTTMIDIMDYQPWINTEWLDYLKLDMPTDPDSLYKVLKAFQTGDPNQNGNADEIPLIGGQEAGLGADVINWLINMFLYFNDHKHFAIDDDGQVYAPFTTDEYRKALQYVRKLYSEKLMPDSVITMSMNELPVITTPPSGKAKVGIFVGHLTLHADCENEVLKQYQPLPIWGNAVFNDNRFNANCFIGGDCKNVEKAFEVMMTIWSEEGSRRIRYGEYGVNWTDADPGVKSPLGLDAKFKLLKDPLREMNTCLWSGASCTLCVNAEKEDAQLAEELKPGEKLREEMHAKSYANFKKAYEENNPDPKYICPTLVLTEEEKEDTKPQREGCADYYKKSRTAFCVGDMDPNSDAKWNEYLNTLEDLGLQDWLDVAQVAYDRY